MPKTIVSRNYWSRPVDGLDPQMQPTAVTEVSSEGLEITSTVQVSVPDCGHLGQDQQDTQMKAVEEMSAGLHKLVKLQLDAAVESLHQSAPGSSDFRCLNSLKQDATFQVERTIGGLGTSWAIDPTDTGPRFYPLARKFQQEQGGAITLKALSNVIDQQVAHFVKPVDETPDGLRVFGHIWPRVEDEEGEKTYRMSGVTLRDAGPDADSMYRFTAEENSSEVGYSASTPENALRGMVGELRDALSAAELVVPPLPGERR